MMKRILALCAALLLPMCALAETGTVCYSWDQEFPDMPVLTHHAYRAEPALPDGDALAGALWAGLPWSKQSDELGVRYTLAAADNPRGRFREDLYVEDDAAFYLWEYNEKTPAQAEIGGCDRAFGQAEAFLRAWLPAEMLEHSLPQYGSFDEDGVPTDRYYAFQWAQQVEPGVFAHESAIEAAYYSYGVAHVNLRWHAYVPADGDRTPEYITAEQALHSLNHAAGNIDPEHICTSFDDPEDALVGIQPVFANVFSQDETMTLCWAFSIRDARKGNVRTVLVDAIGGDVYDDHDGRLQGEI